MANLATIAQGSERPVLTLTWTHADNSTGEDLTDAVLTGYVKNLTTGDVVEIQGALTVTDATAGVFTWTPDPQDVAEDGAYQVQFSATWPGEPSPGLTAVFDWEVAESIIPTDAPTALPDYQGVVKLLARTTDPDAAPEGYYGLFVKNAALWLIDEEGALTAFDDGSIAAAAAVAAHVLESDPHTQYLTEAAASSTYSVTGHTHDYAASGHTHDYAASGHNHDAAYISVIGTPTAGNLPTITAGGELQNSTYSPSSFADSGHTHAAAALDDLSDVDAAAPTDGYVLTWSEGDSAWVPAEAATGTGDMLKADYDANADGTVDAADYATNAGDADTVDGSHASAFATSDHTHDYAASGHNHDAAYISVIATPTTGNIPTITSGGELANSAYSPSSFSASGHDHSGVYATAAHNHDSAYISVIGTPTAGNIPTITAGGELDNSAYSPSSFSASGHNHDASYSATGHTHAYIAESLIDAKGDLIVGTADNTPARLAAGTNDYILIADSAQTPGVKWGTNAPDWANVTNKPSIYQSTLFLHTAASGVSTYKTLLTTPSALSETTAAVGSVTSGSGELLIAAFASPPMGVSVINGNAWTFKTYAKVDSNTGVSNIVIRVYSRTAAGVETQLFYDTSAEINATTPTLYELESVQTSFAVAATDRLVIKYYAKTTSAGARTFTLYFQGSDNYSHISTPVLFASLTMASDTIWDAKGDLAVGTGADTAQVLTVGVTNGMVLTVDSAETTGLKWVTPTTPIAASLLDAKGDLVVASAADTPARLAVGATNGMVLTVASGESTGVKWALPVRYITLGRAGTLTATAGTARVYVPFACTITGVRASVGTAPTGASVIVDVLLNNATIWGTNPGNRPTITATNYSDLTNTPDTTAIAADDYLTLTVAQIGSTIAGADLIVTLVVTVP